MKRGIADAALGRLEGEGHDDGAAELLRAGRPVLRQPGVGIVELELPLAVQALPLFALELRLGIFGTRDLLRRGDGTGGRQDQQASHADIICKPGYFGLNGARNVW